MNFKCAYKELVSVKDLRPHPKNTNKHTKEQIERLAKLIEYQGQRSSVVVSKRSGFLVKGHATLQAIKKLNWASAAVDYQDFDSDDQELAYLTSDNAIASWASLDRGMINDQLKDLGPDFDIEWLGLDGFKMDLENIDLPELGDGKDSMIITRSFTLTTEQSDHLDEALKKAESSEDCKDEINQNKNGNILAAMARAYSRER